MMVLMLFQFLIDRLRLLWAQRRRRVLRQEVGEWPKVFADKWGFKVEGGYYEPQARHNAAQAGAVVFWLVWAFLTFAGLSSSEADVDVGLVIGVMIVAAYYAMFPGVAVWIAALIVLRKNLDVRLFRDGSIRVNGRRSVGATGFRSFVVVQHEDALNEQRAEGRYFRKNPRGKDFRTDFRDGSQVFILTGYSGMHRRAVAALENDQRQHWGNILRSTLEELNRLIQELPAEARIMPRTPLGSLLHGGRAAALWSLRQGWRGVRASSGAAAWRARRAIAARSKASGRGRVPAPVPNARRHDQP